MGIVGSFFRGKAAGAWSWPLTYLMPRSRVEELYLHSPIYFHGIVINQFSTGIILPLLHPFKPITVVERSQAWTVFSRLETGFESHSRHGCLRLFCVCVVGNDLATGWSPVQGVLQTVFGLRNCSETKRFIDALCSRGSDRKRERKREIPA
jgi:hypothetical protein